MIETTTNASAHIKQTHLNRIAILKQCIQNCNEAICSKNIQPFERKEYELLKKDYCKQLIGLIKLLREPIWN